MFNIELPSDPEIPFLGKYPREIKAYVHTNSLYMKVHSIIHSNQNVETIQMSMNWWMDE